MFAEALLKKTNPLFSLKAFTCSSGTVHLESFPSKYVRRHGPKDRSNITSATIPFPRAIQVWVFGRESDA